MRMTGLLILAGMLLPLAGMAVVQKAPVSSQHTGKDAGAVAQDEGHGTLAVAPTAAQAEQAYQAARHEFLTVAKGSAPGGQNGDVDEQVSGTTTTVSGGTPDNVALENIHLVMDVENVTLREVMVKIVSQAAAYTGPWTVKWRLKPEDTDLMSQRVNLTAEADFGEFCSLLTERVKNMTGVQLFVTVFPAARVLMVSDTYY